MKTVAIFTKSPKLLGAQWEEEKAKLVVDIKERREYRKDVF